MEETYTIPMAVMDFIPNLAFLVGAFFLVRLVLRERGRRCGRMLMLSSLLVFLGGMLKALWKLLYAAQVADVRLFSEAQFVLLSIGFVGVVVSVILLARRSREIGSAALAMAAWKIPFLAIMTIANIGAQGILTYIAFRRKLPWSATLFIIGALCIFGMGGMASGEQTISRQWIEQSINSIGQISFAFGCFLLERGSRKIQPDTDSSC